MATSGKSDGKVDAATRPAVGSVGTRGRKLASGVRGAAGNVAGGQVTPLVRKGSPDTAEGGRAAGGKATDRVRKGTAAAAGTGRSAANKVVSTGTGIGTGAVGAVGSVVGSAMSALMHAVVRVVPRAGLRAGLRYVVAKALLLLELIKRLALWLRGQVASLMQRLNPSTEGDTAPAH